jgi:hypothetical protein
LLRQCNAEICDELDHGWYSYYKHNITANMEEKEGKALAYWWGGALKRKLS